MATTPVSPKVTATAVAGVIAAAVLPYISPDLFSGLGKYSGLVYGLVIAVIVTVAGYVKTDPLRAITASASSPVVDTPAPAVSFAPTQARIDAVTAPEVTAPEITAP